MNHQKSQPDLLFEVSWEVCNKVGGIYTVLSTKAKTLTKTYKDQVIFIGPDIWCDENPSLFFEESQSLLNDWKKDLNLPYGIKVRVGRWLIPGTPIVILVDYKTLYSQKDNIYSLMWEQYNVDSLHAYGDYDESCMFGVASAVVIDNYYRYINSQSSEMSALAHFDEWTTGMGLLYLKSICPAIATVFTTHATSIGRSICCNGKPLYDYMKGYNGDQMADELNMQSKHSLEKRAAHNSDCFTTVSEVTAKECNQLLEIDPVITPNGFEKNFVPSATEYKKKRQIARDTLLNVARTLTGGNIADDAILIATSGRNEFRNKGIDAYIDAINVLRNDNNLGEKEVVAFILVPSWIDGPRADLSQKIQENASTQLCERTTTHSLHEGYFDCISDKIHFLGFQNQPTDKVKLVYVPSYLNGNDGIFNLPYYDILIGFDCTVFPSYYEPWGYTPLESIAFGIPTITTDLSGFGQWILSNYGNDIVKTGVAVVHRGDSNYSEVVQQISDTLLNIIKSDITIKKGISKAASKIAGAASWAKFFTFYKDAYKKAMINCNTANS